MTSGFIPEDIINNIAARLNIVDIINEYVPLKQKGRNLQGLCPFHNEKTPSFTVSPDKQIFHCFGCGVGGNVFSFVMQREGLTFPEAIESLAAKANVTLPKHEVSPAQKKIAEQKERYYKINESTARFYQKNLKASTLGKEALNYLKKRQLSQETIEKFQIGLAPPQWDGLIKFFEGKGVKIKELLELGLVLPNKTGTSYYDRFRNRIIFPIWDSEGRVVAFGGRVLDDSLPKYLNSPDTPLFNKSQHLYGINLAKHDIRRADLALILEGYMDVIVCSQYGINNAVASLGTAFTQQQAKLLMRHTYQIAIIYDADAAGANATLRSLEILSDLGCDVRVINLPEGLDPDDYIRSNGAEKFKELIAAGQGLIEYKLAKSMENVNLNSIMGKTKVVQELLPDLLKMSSAVVRAEAIKIISSKLGINEANILSELRKYSQNYQKPKWSQDRTQEKREDNNALPLAKLSKTEVQLVKILFEDNLIIDEVENTGGEEIFAEPLKELYCQVRTIYKDKGKVLSTDLHEANSKLLAAVLMEELKVVDLKRAAADYIKILKLNKLNRDYAVKRQELKEAETRGDITIQTELLEQLDVILQQKKLLTP